MELALIGNCAYQALVDEGAVVRWLCWPRFDSDFVFGSLLDEDGGAFSIQPANGGWASAAAYEPLTNVLRTTFDCPDGRFEVIDFAPRFRQYARWFKPTMLCRRVVPLEGQPRIRVTCQPVADQGRRQVAPYASSNHLGWMTDEGPMLRLTTSASLTAVASRSAFVLDGPVDFVLTWGRPLEAPLEETVDRFLSRTRDYWQTWSKHVSLPTRWQEQVLRSALVLKLHQFEDTGAITAAATTSLPEYPGAGRNWDYRYCWLRDAAFTLGALGRLGHFEETERFARYLLGIATDKQPLQPVYGIGAERVLEERVLEHLAGFEGNQPVRVGNEAWRQVQHDVYGEMLAAIAPLMTDVRYRTHATSMRPVLERLLGEVERFLDAPDVGLWEKRDEPRVHTYTMLMHWVGARAARQAAQHSGEVAVAERARAIEVAAGERIERAWRPERGWYADALDTDAPDASLMMLVNVGYLSPKDPRALQHVDALAKALDADGAHLHRYLHDDGLGQTHAAFTVCGFWYAEALARLGQLERAERVFEQLLSGANGHGLLSEDVDPASGRSLGNFPQTYSHVGVIRAAFQIAEKPHGWL